MSQSTNRMAFPYPARDDDPWFDDFESFASALDASGYAHREDRSLIFTGGGTLSWTLGTETLTWTGSIQIASPIGGRLISISADSIVIADGQVVYVTLTRQPLENITAALVVADQLPSSNTAAAFAVRIGGTVYFRTGISLTDGTTADSVAPVPGGTSTDTDAIHDNVAGEIAAITEKVSPDTGDVFIVEDSTDSNNKKKVQFGNLGSTDSDAIHDNVAGEIDAISEKGSPAAGDWIIIEDSADSNNKKKAQVGNISGSSSDVRGPAIVVGNSPAGDTSTDCDYLDTGDGAQLAAAIAAAAGSPDLDVWIRPGTYDFSTGAVVSAVSIPDDVRVRGAGKEQVTIAGRSDQDLTMFLLGTDSALEDVTCTLPITNEIIGVASSGLGVITAKDELRAVCRRVAVSIPFLIAPPPFGWATAAADACDLTGAFTAECTPGISASLTCIECTASGPALESIRSGLTPKYFNGFQAAYSIAGNPPPGITSVLTAQRCESSKFDAGFSAIDEDGQDPSGKTVRCYHCSATSGVNVNFRADRVVDCVASSPSTAAIGIRADQVLNSRVEYTGGGSTTSDGIISGQMCNGNEVDGYDIAIDAAGFVCSNNNTNGTIESEALATNGNHVSAGGLEIDGTGGKAATGNWVAGGLVVGTDYVTCTGNHVVSGDLVVNSGDDATVVSSNTLFAGGITSTSDRAVISGNVLHDGTTAITVNGDDNTVNNNVVTSGSAIVLNGNTNVCMGNRVPSGVTDNGTGNLVVHNL